MKMSLKTYIFAALLFILGQLVYPMLQWPLCFTGDDTLTCNERKYHCKRYMYRVNRSNVAPRMYQWWKTLILNCKQVMLGYWYYSIYRTLCYDTCSYIVYTRVGSYISYCNHLQVLLNLTSRPAYCLYSVIISLRVHIQLKYSGRIATSIGNIPQWLCQLTRHILMDLHIFTNSLCCETLLR